MPKMMKFIPVLFISLTTLAADLESTWTCDKGYTEILWCEKTSGIHDFERISYCQKTDTMKTANLISQLVIVRDDGDENFTREIALFKSVKEEGFGTQKGLVFYFEGAMKLTGATDKEWSGKYIEYRFTPRSQHDAEDFTHKLYGTHHEVTNKQRADGTWSRTDIGVAVGKQNEPNLMNCYKPE